jgi:hypothetical protein
VHEADSFQQAGNAELRARDPHGPGAGGSSSVWHRVLPLLLVLVLMGAGIAWVWSLIAAGRTEMRPTEAIEAATDEDDSLSVRWTGTECDELDRVEVVEEGDAVLVTLYVTSPYEGCPGDEVTRTAHVPLEAPLGEREVVDGACVPPDATC